LALVSFVRHPPPYGAYTLLPCAILPLIMYFVRKVKKFFDEAFDFSVGLYIPFPLIINSVHDEAYCFERPSPRAQPVYSSGKTPSAHTACAKSRGPALDGVGAHKLESLGESHTRTNHSFLFIADIYLACSRRSIYCNRVLVHNRLCGLV
jgi:hypothetical protein